MSSAAYSRGFQQQQQRATVTSGSSNEPLTGNSTGPSSAWYQETLPPSPSSPLPPPPPPPQQQRHPYQLAGFDFRGDVDDDSDVGYNQGRVGYTPVTRTSNLDSEKLPPILPSSSVATSRAYTLPAASQQRPAAAANRLAKEGEETGTLTRILRNPLVILLLFLPLPPLLSILYTAAGHAILQTATNASVSPRSTYAAPILSSVNAAATGGIILSLPIALLLYILLVPDSFDPLRPVTSFSFAISPSQAPASSSTSSSTPNTNPHSTRPRTHRRRPTPEDFFDDSDSSTAFFSLTSLAANFRLYTGYLTCTIFVVFIGAFAAPLGVTCLMRPSDRFLPRRRLLSTRAAAVAGVVGGVVLVGLVVVLAVGGLVGWGFWMRRSRMKMEERGSLQA